MIRLLASKIFLSVGLALQACVGAITDMVVHFFASWPPTDPPQILRLSTVPPIIRRIVLTATALNGRQSGGVRCRGDLGTPSVRMLAG